MGTKVSARSRSHRSIRSAVESLETRRMLASVSGYVFYDVDRSGGDFSGVDVKGLPGIEVFLSTNGDAIKDVGEPTTTTDANGNFVFNDVLVGSYILQVTPPANQAPTYPNGGAGQGLMVLGADIIGQNLGLVSTLGTAAGVVYADNNQNGIHDNGEPGIEYVRVYYDANNNGIFDDGTERFAFTDAGGNWHIGALQNGTHRMAISQGDTRAITAPLQGYYDVVISNHELDEGADFGLVDIQNQLAGKARGTVFYDTNGNGIKDVGEGFAENFQVYVDIDNSGTRTQADKSSFTNAQGEWQFLDLQPGTYTIRIDQGDQWNVSTPQGATFSVTILTVNDDTTVGAFGVTQQQIPDTSAINGRIFNDTNGNGVQDIGETGRNNSSVFLDSNNNGIYDAGFESAFPVDANGNYSIPGLIAGTYSIGWIPEAGFRSVAPVNGVRSVTLNAGVNSNNNNFAVAASVHNDFNGDGKPDLLFRQASTGTNTVWFMDGATRIGTATLPSQAGTNWIIGGTGDFNNDGKTDVLFHNIATGQNVVWFMNGTTRTSSIALDSAAVAWRINGVGDFNNDGKSDILFRNTATGAATVWYMNGTHRTGYGALPWVDSQNWQISAVEDFDGDGDADLVWTNASARATSLWLMNGVAVAQDGFRGLAYPVQSGWSLAKVADFNKDGSADLLWAPLKGAPSLWLLTNVISRPVTINFSSLAGVTSLPV